MRGCYWNFPAPVWQGPGHNGRYDKAPSILLTERRYALSGNAWWKNHDIRILNVVSWNVNEYVSLPGWINYSAADIPQPPPPPKLAPGAEAKGCLNQWHSWKKKSPFLPLWRNNLGTLYFFQQDRLWRSENFSLHFKQIYSYIGI